MLIPNQNFPVKPPTFAEVATSCAKSPPEIIPNSQPIGVPVSNNLNGNNIPVCFIQDAIKYPEIIHAVTMLPDRGFPQNASAHDTFWDFISLTPESMHLVMWIMSDRTLPRSLRMIEGFVDEMAARQRFELQLTDPETVVLPLDERAARPAQYCTRR